MPEGVATRPKRIDEAAKEQENETPPVTTLRQSHSAKQRPVRDNANRRDLDEAKLVVGGCSTAAAKTRDNERCARQRFESTPNTPRQKCEERVVQRVSSSRQPASGIKNEARKRGLFHQPTADLLAHELGRQARSEGRRRTRGFDRRSAKRIDVKGPKRPAQSETAAA